MSDLAPEEAACRCDEVEYPTVVSNRPGQPQIAYRVAEFPAVRRALLRSLPGEQELAAWRATASGDLGLQILEWWAYLADVLTFYNERIANESYLGTAVLSDTVGRLVRLLGYRPRPGIGAVGTIAALSRRPTEPLALPAGMGITSTPTPGVAPQVFEAAAATFTGPPSVPVTLDPDPSLVRNTSLLLSGKVTGIQPDDRYLLIERAWQVTDGTWSVVTVQSTATEPDPAGGTNTRVLLTFAGSSGAPAMGVISEGTAKNVGMAGTAVSGYGLYWSASGTAASSPPPPPASGGLVPSGAAGDYRLLRSTSQASLWSSPAPTNKVLTDTTAHLSAAVRSISAGDIVLFDGRTAGVVPTLVTGYTERVYFVRQNATDDPAVPPATPSASNPVLPVPHSVLTVRTPPSTALSGLATALSAVAVRSAWHDVGRLIGTPATTLSSLPVAVSVPASVTVPAGGMRAFLEDADGGGVLVEATSAGAGRLLLSAPAGASSAIVPALKAPLRLLLDLVDVSRGKTVSSEVLGAGDARVPGQVFGLKKSPLTYLGAGASYVSTLTVWVNGLRWTEVPTFFDQPADARVYVTRERPDGTTEVRFGDGVNGARLPSGVANVVARYRFGSGAQHPPVRALTSVLDPEPNLASVRNPVTVGGGDDPDPPDKMRQYAPKSVFTFGRAISGIDYEAIAATAPGVKRARAYWTWDPDEQRSLVKVYVGDDDAARASAADALTGAADPNRPVVVARAAGFRLRMSLTLIVAPDRVPADVAAAARAALVDPDHGLFSPTRMRIGAALYRSQLEAALLVDGAVGVHALTVARDDTGVLVSAVRLSSGEGGFFSLDPSALDVTPEPADG